MHTPLHTHSKRSFLESYFCSNFSFVYKTDSVEIVPVNMGDGMISILCYTISVQSGLYCNIG